MLVNMHKISQKSLSKDNCKGAVIKYGIHRGRRDSAGSPKLLSAKCWANKLVIT